MVAPLAGVAGFSVYMERGLTESGLENKAIPFRLSHQPSDSTCCGVGSPLPKACPWRCSRVQRPRTAGWPLSHQACSQQEWGLDSLLAGTQLKWPSTTKPCGEALEVGVILTLLGRPVILTNPGRKNRWHTKTSETRGFHEGAVGQGLGKV